MPKICCPNTKIMSFMKKNANFANINVLFGEEGTRKVALLETWVNTYTILKCV
jgi:hypothetical protein